MLNKEVQDYNDKQEPDRKEICQLLAEQIQTALPDHEYKLWHGAPVWFSDGNPIAGYDNLKDCVRLLFWSGQSFEEPGLNISGTFKAAEARYTSVDQVNLDDLKRWLEKSAAIQWDYKNIVKNKGQLNRTK